MFPNKNERQRGKTRKLGSDGGIPHVNAIRLFEGGEKQVLRQQKDRFEAFRGVREVIRSEHGLQTLMGLETRCQREGSKRKPPTTTL